MKDYMNPSLAPEVRARLLLAQMSAEEKLTQLVGYMPFVPGEYDVLKKDYPYGVGNISCLAIRCLKTLDEALKFQRDIQEIAMSQSPHHIPAMFHMEGLCGAYIPEAASFPSGIGRASGWDPQLEKEIGGIVGRQERFAGITQTFAPVLDISRDSRMGRQGETYGEDASLAAALGSAYTAGVQAKDETGRRTDAVAKHFLGFHAGAAGIHGADAQISQRELRETYAKPFQAAITESGLKGIMPCYCALNGEPVSVSKEILTDMLRNEMGFDGVVVSDYGAIQNAHTIHKMGESEAEIGLRSMDAGMDMELPNKACYNDDLLNILKSSKEAASVLDRAVERVLTAKFRMGLFENPFAEIEKDKATRFHNKDDERVILQSARESLVLLKNDGVLPIKNKKSKIAVIGSQAATARIFFGGYTHFSMAEGLLAAIASMAGVRDTIAGIPENMKTYPGTPVQSDDAPEFEALMQAHKPGIRSLLDELREKLPQAEIIYAKGFDHAGDDKTGFPEALAAAQKADIVIVTLGGKHGTSSIASMGEGVDAVDIGLPQCQKDFLQLLETLRKPVVGVHFNGRPISCDIADRVCNAILEAWNPAEKGAQAIAEVLLGEMSPSGKLPVSVARTAGQIPIYYNHPNGSNWHQGESIGFPNYVDCSHTPRYPFGHGLSYADFEYSDLLIEKEAVKPTEKAVVSFKIKNTGDLCATEIVQLYITDDRASMVRPTKELFGFCRVELAAGESKTVRFILDPSQTAFLDRNMRWKIEKGSFSIQIGSSSEDIRLNGSLTVTDDLFIQGSTRISYSLGKVSD